MCPIFSSYRLWEWLCNILYIEVRNFILILLCLKYILAHLFIPSLELHRFEWGLSLLHLLGAHYPRLLVLHRGHLLVGHRPQMVGYHLQVVECLLEDFHEDTMMRPVAQISGL